MMRFARFAMVLVLFAVPSFAQDRSLWRTAADIREGARGSVVGSVVDLVDSRNELQLEPDNDRSSRVTVIADSVTTQYNGFGGVINGKPEIFTGSSGFTNVRVGDRIEVRGMGRGVGALIADQLTLLGRSIAAPQTGIGTTRSPSSMSTPSNVPMTGERMGRIEGVVRDVSVENGRVHIETDRREFLTIRTSSTTPVQYRGETYRISNLEIGDRIRVIPESSTTSGEIRARSIEVVQSVQDGGVGGNRIGSLNGRVTRVDRNLDMIRIDSGRGEVRVDLAAATDDSGRQIRADQFEVGDRVELSGRYGTNGDVFLASSVRRSGVAGGSGVRAGSEIVVEELGAVTIYGTVRETLDSSPHLLVQERSGGRTIRFHVLDDFVVRTKTNAYTTADKLKLGDSLVVKAYRDGAGNYIAQTIRIR